MKKYAILILVSILCYGIKAQDNPYEVFGYKTNVVYETPITEYLYIINTDTSTNIHAIVFIAEKNIAMVLNRQDSIIACVNIKPDELFRWLSVDPMASQRSWVSPYNFVQNNPINRIDPNGALDNPIYDEETSEFLGTDDLGLQGDAIIMNKSDFKQGMSHEKAMTVGNTLDNMSWGDAFKFANNGNFENFMNHYNNLNTRPDWDGYLTLDEANEWYRNGNGQPLFTDLSKIDLSGIYSLGESYVGQVKTFNLLLNSGSINDGLVYGQVTLKRYPNHSVRAYADEYNFEMHNGWNPLNWPRNAQTVIGGAYAGDGKKYEINMYGSQQLTPILPWIK